MPIIDFHAHFFPDDLPPCAIGRLLATTPTARTHTDGTLGGLKRSMAESGITASVALPVATKASQVHSINRSAAELRLPGIIPFGSLYPKMEEVEGEVAFLKKSGIRGIKFHPEFQDFYADDPAMYPVYEALADAGLMVVFHAGKDPGPFTNDHSTPQRIAQVCRAFPSLTMVAAHMGGHEMWDEVATHLAGLPLYFDTSAAVEFLAPEEFVRLCRSHGMERILFGSDTPWYDQTGSRKWIEELPLTDAEKDLVFFRNAEGLLGAGEAEGRH